MAMMRDTSAAQIAVKIADGAVDQFEVFRYRGTEGFCQLYRFEVEAATTAEVISFDSIVGKSAALSINTDYGTRYFHGIVSRLEFTGDTVDQAYYRIEIVPKFWLLTHRYNSRIFQKESIKDIILKVLEQAGITSDQVDVLGLKGKYAPRDYCVQYRETDYNFCCRLMEEAGIRWYFDQTAEGHKLVLADDATSYTAIAGDSANMPYVPPSGMNVSTGQEHIYRYRLGQCVRPGAVVLNEFTFTNPKLKLKAPSDCGRDKGLEYYDYPGEYDSQGSGGDLAKMRAEEFESARILGMAQSNSPRLAVGKTFDLVGHTSAPMNASYVVTAMTHQGKQSISRTSTGTDAVRGFDGTANRPRTQWFYHGGQVVRDSSATAVASGRNPLDALTLPNLLDDPQHLFGVDVDAAVYDNSLECMPAAVVYRPPRITPWPVMRGAQTAIVVGPASEEIHTDEYGRIKVHFHWDREGKFDDTASCWIRVSQAAAGGNYGLMFLPRVGWEVIVDFLEGDPDQPIVTGCVYNKDHMPPYTLPDEKTKSVIKTNSSIGGEGTNEIRFEDLKDSEQVLIYSQKDFHQRTNLNRVENVGAKEKGDYHLTVEGEKYELAKKSQHREIVENLIEKIGGDVSLTVEGKTSVKVAGTQSVDVTGDVVEAFGAGHKHEVTMTYALKALGVKIEADTGIELKCGGCSIILTPAAIFITGGPLVNINTGSGPPVTAPTASATSPEEPEAPVDADDAVPGTDTTYSGGDEPTPAEMDAEIVGETFEPVEVEPTPPTSFIDLELLDEEGLPVAGERYVVIDSKGKEHKGSLDANGKAHVIVPEGQCTVSYPDLDAESWERTS